MKKSRQAAVWCMTGFLLMCVSGCGGASVKQMSGGYDAAASDAPAEVYEEAVSYQEDYDAGAVTSENGIESVVQNGRKLIKTVRLEMQTREFDSLVVGLQEKIEELNGYVESSSVWGNSYYSSSTRSSEYTIRIPADRLDEFIEAAGGMGNVTYKNESVEDVTLQYVDVESRQKALETEQSRLLELLEQADNLEDLLTIESRLSEVRYELENYGSQKRVLDNQIDYSTVYLTISEVERITETGEKTFFEEIADRFENNLYHVGRGIREFVIVLIGSLPVLAVWAAVIAAAVLAVRKIFYGKKKEKKEKKSFWRKRKPVNETEGQDDKAEEK